MTPWEGAFRRLLLCCGSVASAQPLMLAAGLGRLAGILLVVRGIQDILNASRYHYGILPAVITTVLGAVLIALPMTTSRVVISLCGLLVLIVGIAILVDRLKTVVPRSRRNPTSSTRCENRVLCLDGRTGTKRDGRCWRRSTGKKPGMNCRPSP